MTAAPMVTSHPDGVEDRNLGRRSICKEPRTRVARHSKRSPSPVRGRSIRFSLTGCDDATASTMDSVAESFLTLATLHLDQVPALRVKRQSVSLRKAYKATTSENLVAFGEVEVFSHPVVLGDNPSVSAGPPLTLDWRASDYQRFSVDEHQATTAPRRMDQLKIGRVRRHRMLVAAGFTAEDIERVVTSIRRIQQSRRKTAEKSDRAVTSKSQRVSAGKAPAFLRWFGPKPVKMSKHPVIVDG